MAATSKAPLNDISPWNGDIYGTLLKIRYCISEKITYRIARKSRKEGSKPLNFIRTVFHNIT